MYVFFQAFQIFSCCFDLFYRVNILLQWGTLSSRQLFSWDGAQVDQRRGSNLLILQPKINNVYRLQGAFIFQNSTDVITHFSLQYPIKLQSFSARVLPKQWKHNLLSYIVFLFFFFNIFIFLFSIYLIYQTILNSNPVFHCSCAPSRLALICKWNKLSIICSLKEHIKKWCVQAYLKLTHSTCLLFGNMLLITAPVCFL